jgi:hypothetical protein
MNTADHTLSRTSTITLHGPLAHVFPLFGPVRESEWAPDWAPDFIGGPPAALAEHLVFVTPAHDPAESDYVWTLSQYAPEQSALEYTVFTPERLWWITIKCRAVAGGAATEATITYTYTGLTAPGHVRNAQALHAMYAHDLKDWERAINHYLATGAALAPH